MSQQIIFEVDDLRCRPRTRPVQFCNKFFIRGRVRAREKHVDHVRVTPWRRSNSSNTIMSDKIREFIEVPQQFIRDGNQVCQMSGTARTLQTNSFQFLTRCTKPSQQGLWSPAGLLAPS